MQRPQPDNTLHLQETDIHDLGGIRTHNPSKRAAADPRLSPRDHWDRLVLLYLIVMNSILFVIKISVTLEERPQARVALNHSTNAVDDSKSLLYRTACPTHYST
jgi:hypothetical protein